jgi:hypothetical protein
VSLQVPAAIEQVLEANKDNEEAIKVRVEGGRHR